ARKRKREEAPTKTIQRPINDETDDEFGADDDIKVVDLVDAVEVPDSIRAPKPPNNEVKLSAFQCVICMDDVTDLTVTHCGHLFCAECLHSSLNIDVTRSICPICRQKIDIKLANGKFTSKSKGFYPLELKFATRKGLGKR
ncbi:putative SLX8 protein, partial [Podospora didyma]